MEKILISAAIGLVFTIVTFLPTQNGAADEYAEGKKLFSDNCQICHGADGKGNGPAAAALSPKPANFTDPKFWEGDVDKKITHTIEHGHGMMPAFNLNTDKIKDIIDYLTHTFKPKS